MDFKQVISSVRNWTPTTVGTLQKWVCADARYRDLCIVFDRDGAASSAPPVDGKASWYYNVHQGGSIVDTVILVEVIGGPDATVGARALLPLPDVGEGGVGGVSLYRYGLARIVNQSEPNLEWAMQAAGYGIPTS